MWSGSFVQIQKEGQVNRAYSTCKGSWQNLTFQMLKDIKLKIMLPCNLLEIRAAWAAKSILFFTMKMIFWWNIWSNFDHSLIQSRKLWIICRVSYLPWLATANHTLCSEVTIKEHMFIPNIENFSGPGGWSKVIPLWFH